MTILTLDSETKPGTRCALDKTFDLGPGANNVRGWAEISVADRCCCDECPTETIDARPTFLHSGDVAKQHDSSTKTNKEGKRNQSPIASC